MTSLRSILIIIIRLDLFVTENSKTHNGYCKWTKKDEAESHNAVDSYADWNDGDRHIGETTRR